MKTRIISPAVAALVSLSLLGAAAPLAQADTEPAPSASSAPVAAPTSTPSATPTAPVSTAPTPTAPSSGPAPATRLPYTGSTSLPVDQRRAPLTTRTTSRLTFESRRSIGSGWPAEGLLMMNDFTGNKRADIVQFFREGDSVKIRLYEGQGNGYVRDQGVVGWGWNAFTYIVAGDINGDGLSDLLGRKDNGELWFYKSAGASRFHSGVKVGWGWSMMRSLTYVPATASGLPSIMATDTSGRLYRYPFRDRNGNFGDKITYGLGWRQISRILPAGDVDRNGQPDFYATDSAGDLYLYEAARNGVTYTSYRIGSGWSMMSQVMSVSRELEPGIYGVDHAGSLYFYPLRLSAPAPASPEVSSPWLKPVTAITKPGWTVTPQLWWNGTKVRTVRLALGQGAPLNSSMTFDYPTRSAVVRFQQRAGLRATGVVDATTWGRLTSRSWWMDNWQMPPQVGLGASRAQRVEAMIRFANLAKGAPYTWGGAGPWQDGFDCSGLALQALYAAGYDPQPINVVSHAAPSYRSSKELYAHPKLQRVPFSQRQRGDLVFWAGSGGIYHVAIYLGNNQIIEAYFGHVHQRDLYNWGNIAPYVKRAAH